MTEAHVSIRRAGSIPVSRTMGYIKRHAPLIVLAVVGIIATVISFMLGVEGWAAMLVAQFAGGVWALVILMIAMDVTPRHSKEKKEKGT